MQTEGISFSLEDKLAIAGCLDELGVDYIEGGYPASGPKDTQFFAEVAKLGFRNSKITAFGSTRRIDNKAEDDASLNAIVSCKAPAATIVGKTWDLHVTKVLGCSLEDNIAVCADSVRYLKKHGLEVIFDAEHFYDGYKENPEYALKVLRAVAEAGIDAIALCDTNGGTLPNEIYEITKTVCGQLKPLTIGIHTHNDNDCAIAFGEPLFELDRGQFHSVCLQVRDPWIAVGYLRSSFGQQVDDIEGRGLAQVVDIALVGNADDVDASAF